MDANAVMDRLAELGVVASAAGGKLLLEPGSKVPPDLLAQVKEHKVEILARLTRPHQDAEALLTRLRKGQAWLVDEHQRWQADDTTAAADEAFSKAWNLWWDLDTQLRVDHGFAGCIHGSTPACPEGFPCQGCSEAPAPGVVAQLALTRE